MTTAVLIVLCVAALIIGVAAVVRALDYRANGAEKSRLLAFQPEKPAVFDLAMIRGLPEPARRYFAFTIAPGTPLLTVASLAMTGRFSLGSKGQPDYLQMTAEQTLAAPHGFVWSMRAKRGPLRVSGADSGRWSRFWAMGLIPVARSGGDADHHRSAFGRCVAEAAFWTPAALLPGPGIRWDALDQNTARVTVAHGGLEQSVDLTVDATGQPTVVVFPRWSNANPEKTHRIQPFGGYLADFRTFAGFTLPTRIEAGNHFGSDDYFPFYVAAVSDLRFPEPTPG